MFRHVAVTAALVRAPLAHRAGSRAARNRLAMSTVPIFAAGCEHPRQHELYFLPLGGCEEIGLNANLYHTDGQWLMVDLGNRMPPEFMAPGLELLLPDVSFIASRRSALAGLVITHGHEDHIGAIPYLWPQLRCPIYATNFAVNLIKAKLKDSEFRDEVEYRIVEPNLPRQIGPFNVTWQPMAHSIPESNAIVLKTMAGTVFHTGDWKFDDQPVLGTPTSYSKLQQLGDEGVLAVVGDSTNARHEGFSRSEGKLRDNFLDMFQKIKTKGSIIVTCFSSNIARLDTVATAAELSGRMSGLNGRSMEINAEIAKNSGYLAEFDLPPSERTQLMPIDRLIERAPPEKRVILCTGCQGEPHSALQRISEGTHSKVSLSPADTVIFSSSVIPDNEGTLFALKARLQQLGVAVMENDTDNFTHVSGHPLRGELRRLFELLRPRIVLPVHGRVEHLTEHAALARAACSETIAHVPSNGSVYRLSTAGVEEVATVPTGVLVLESSLQLRALRPQELLPPTAKETQRRGHCVVSVILAADGALTASPMVTLQGIDAAPSVTALVSESIESIFKGLGGGSGALALDARAALCRRIQDEVLALTGASPATQLFVHRARSERPVSGGRPASMVN